LNLPAIQLVNFTAYPLQLIFFVPFVKIGESIFGIDALPTSFASLIDVIQTDLLNALSLLWLSGIISVDLLRHTLSFQ